MTSSTFNIKRFWKYFKYDFTNATNTYWITALILALLPAFLFFTLQLSSKVILGDWIEELVFISIIAFAGSAITFLLSFPQKVYGKITDKKAGSGFLLMPVSSFEKWLSMVLVCCIAAPLAIFIPFFGIDALLSWCFNSYPQPLLVTFNDLFGGTIDFVETSIGANSIMASLIAYIILSHLQSVLIYLLGAIWFKRAKAAKTILCIMGISFVFNILTILVIGCTGLDSLIENVDPQVLFKWMNIIILSINTACVLLLGWLTFRRVKTLKH